MSTSVTPDINPLFRAAHDQSERKTFREKFDKQPFLFHHRLSEEPLFEFPAIRALADRLPGKVHFNGDLAVDKGWKDSTAKKVSFQESLDQLAQGQSWIILKKVHEDRDYAVFMRECLREVEEMAGKRLEPLIESRTMSLILSSPNQVTPYHVDADCNFLVQIRGRKMFYVFDGRDRSILTQEEEEAFWGGDISAAKFREEIQSKAWSYQMEPGNGVHVPVMFPHWVKNDNNISVSLSMNFRFNGSIYGDVHRANRILRKVGIRPGDAGKSAVADSVKAFLVGKPRAGVQKIRKLRNRAS
jgi:hypothetical protein